MLIHWWKLGPSMGGMRSDPEPGLPVQPSKSTVPSYDAPSLITQSVDPSMPGFFSTFPELFCRQKQLPALQCGRTPLQLMQLVPQWALSLLVS